MLENSALKRQDSEGCPGLESREEKNQAELPKSIQIKEYSFTIGQNIDFLKNWLAQLSVNCLWRIPLQLSYGLS